MVRAGAIFSIVLGIAAALTVVLPDRPSFASERPIVLAQNDNGGGFFRRLFGGSRRFAPAAPQRSPLQLFPGFEQPPPPPQQQRRERRVRAPAQPAPREIAAVAKAEDAKRAMVVGDFMAGALAKGLAEAYSENPNVVVIDATSGSSGLVRDDFYDWPAKLPGLVEQQKPDVILVMIGGNDRQTLQDGFRCAGARQRLLARRLRGARRRFRRCAEGDGKAGPLGRAGAGAVRAPCRATTATSTASSASSSKRRACPSSTCGSASPTTRGNTSPSVPISAASRCSFAPATA